MMRRAARAGGARANAQRRAFFPPQAAITGMPLQEGRAAGGGISRSWCAWELRVQPRSKESEAKLGYIGSRVNLDKCEDPGLAKCDVVQLNTYEGGSYVARNDSLAGPENEYIFGEYPNTEAKFRSVYLKPPAKDDYERRVKFYLMLLVPRAITICWTKAFLAGLYYNTGPGAVDLAASSVEVNIDWLEEGQVTVVMMMGKPIFIHHRTDADIDAVKDTPMSELKDPQTDSERHIRAKYAVMVSICTHLGCIPVYGDGEYGAYLCPCHGSHYDASGRIRKGPAPLNLEVPKHYWMDDTMLMLGKDAPQ